jgi:hypothetical protein
MSVNLHLSIIVRGYDPRRREAIAREIRSVIEREQLTPDLPPLAEAEDGRGRFLFSRTDPHRPVIISAAYRWAPVVHQALCEAAERGNGGPCEVFFNWDDADEDRSDSDEEEDDDT